MQMDVSTNRDNKYKHRRVIICTLKHFLWILSPLSEHEPTCRFDGLPSHRDLHRRADQDPYGVILWVQQLVPDLKRETNRETSRGG